MEVGFGLPRIEMNSASTPRTIDPRRYIGTAFVNCYAMPGTGISFGQPNPACRAVPTLKARYQHGQWT